jgi:HK97 family phage portal protein
VVYPSFLCDTPYMGILDFFKAYANPSQPVPNPLNQSRDNFFTGYGNGQFMSLLRRTLPGSQKDWSRISGDLLLNSVVAVGIDWYIRNFPQAIAELRLPLGNGEYETAEDHPVLTLINEPMPGLTSTLVWGWVITDYKAFGNAFVRKIRTSSRGEVVGLQYLPQDMVRPVGDGVTPTTHYVYSTDGRQYDIPVNDMIHFRYGRDPADIRLGRSPLQATLREIAADNMASATAYGMLSNGGIPSILIGPDSNNNADNISPDDARTMKRAIKENLTGDNAGGVVVMTGAYKMDKISFTPQELALDTIRRLPEERISAALGLNPMVLGLGAGLERSTYSNYESAQQAAWEDGMIPTLRVIADTLTISLLPDFGDTDAYIAYNYDDVRALGDDYDAMAVRAERLFKVGIIDRAQGKRMVGIEPDAADEGIMFSSGATPLAGEATGVPQGTKSGHEVPYYNRPFYGFEILPEE